MLPGRRLSAYICAMAYDRYTVTYHLTPDGWVASDEPPADRVLTRVLKVEQPSGWSDREYRTWSTEWAPVEHEAERDRLTKEFGDTPNQKGSAIASN